MARPSTELIDILRRTADRLETGEKYMWGHMGACNCGHLAQELTQLSRAEIHEFAMARFGDWFHQTLEFCPTSGYPLDIVIDLMLQKGLTLSDLRHLERLDDLDVLRQLPPQARNLRQNNRQDVVTYLRAWAGLLEQRLESEVERAAQHTQKAVVLA